MLSQVLLHLQKGGPEHLLSAYGEWFREIASSGHTSWQDYLLDEVSNALPSVHPSLALCNNSSCSRLMHLKWAVHFCDQWMLSLPCTSPLKPWLPCCDSPLCSRRPIRAMPEENSAEQLTIMFNCHGIEILRSTCHADH